MRWLMVWLGLTVASVAAAGIAQPMAEDVALEDRLMTLARDLRCVKCQNQSLADSHAPIAEDLRREIRTLMQQGKSNDEVVTFLVDRYGDFVLYNPPFKLSTALLWGGPLALFLVGMTALSMTIRRRRRLISEVALSPEEKTRVEDLLRGEGGESKP